MRSMLATAGALAVLASGLAATSAAAGSLGPVGAVSIDPSNNNSGTVRTAVSWASVPSDADGTVVCVTPGNRTLTTPSDCESRIVVAAPGLSSGPIVVHQRKSYTFNVFAYQATSPIVYSSPVSVFRHGIKLGFHNKCGDQHRGSTCHITGTITDTFTGRTLAHRTLTLWSSPLNGTHWSRVATATSSRTGQAHTTITLNRTKIYQWRYDSTHAHELNSVSNQYELVVNS